MGGSIVGENPSPYRARIGFHVASFNYKKWGFKSRHINNIVNKLKAHLVAGNVSDVSERIKVISLLTRLENTSVFRISAPSISLSPTSNSLNIRFIACGVNVTWRCEGPSRSLMAAIAATVRSVGCANWRKRWRVSRRDRSMPRLSICGPSENPRFRNDVSESFERFGCHRRRSMT
jgi:hypothetical protein